ncbi:MAG: exo-alpha-sialidase [Chitinophagales bacterium]|nr:exo-alpha-sialidase [Chitinophagales bacterium]
MKYFTIILVSGMSFLMTACNAQSPSIELGAVITIKSQFEGLPVVEPHISAHPTNNNHLLIAAMVVTDISQPYQSCRLSSFVSTDGGINWKETTHDYWGYDPWTAILPDGQTVMSWLGTPEKFKHQFPIQFFSSVDGGASWSKEIQSFPAGHGHDGTKITAMGDDFYFTTVRFNQDMSADVVLYHRHKAGPFSEVATIRGQGVRLNFCEPAILSNGTVIVPSSHFLEKVWVQTYNPKIAELSDKHLISVQPGGAKGYMRMLADANEHSPFKNRIYFVRALGSRQQYEGVWLNYSTDQGESWSKDIRVDHFENGLPSKAMAASIAVNQDGIIGISWVDSQHDEVQEKHDVYFTVSVDGGKSFQPPVRVTQLGTNPQTVANGDVANKFPAGGHYLGITAKEDGSFQLIWSDSRSGLFELQTCNIKVN